MRLFNRVLGRSLGPSTKHQTKQNKQNQTKKPRKTGNHDFFFNTMNWLRGRNGNSLRGVCPA